MNDEIKEILKNIWFRLHCDSPMSKKYGLELEKNECKILLDYITNLQQENKEWDMIFDTFSKRPYAHRYLEEKRKELGNKRIIGLDSEMIYKEYYDYKSRCEKASELIDLKITRLYHEVDYNLGIEDLKDIDNILQNGSDEEC